MRASITPSEFPPPFSWAWRKPTVKVAAGALAVLLLTGCTTLRSEAVGEAAGEGGGRQRLIAYSLPKTMMSAELYATSGGFQLDVSRPVVEPDSRYRLLLAGSPSITSADRYKVEVDPGSGLLKSVTVEAKDQTGEILTALAKSAGGLGAPPSVRALDLRAAANTSLVAQTLFDPLDVASVAAANRQLGEGLKRWAAYQQKAFEDPGPLIEVLSLSGAGGPDLAEPFPTAQAVAASCRRAVCAPVYTAVRVRARAPDGPAVEDVVRAPDPRRLARIDFRRSAFVTRQTSAEFNKGMASSVTVDKPSEMLAVALLPIEIVRASLNAASEIVQLKINYSSKEEAYAKAKAQRSAAQDAASASGETRTYGAEKVSDDGRLLTSQSFTSGSVSRVGGRP